MAPKWGAKPAAVVCHICGREFGTRSIDIHLPQCAKKWEATEALKPKAERRPVPSAPVPCEGLSRDEYNQAAQEKFNTEGLVPCPNCGRTFLADRLEVHLRSCKPKNGLGTGSGPPRKRTGSEPPKEEKQTPSLGSPAMLKPAAVVCHICGREFGTRSIDIHIPQCAKKWEATEALKPKAERRPVPSAPVAGEGLSRDEYNNAAQEKFNTEGLVPCPHCARTFLADRLEVHLRSCKPKHFSPGERQQKDPVSPPKQETQTPSPGSPALLKPAAVVCHICGREFGTRSIDIHLPQCAKKWEATEALKPKAERRPVPSAPVAGKGLSRDEYNQAAQEKFNTEGLVPCPNCGRTFLADRLEIHLRSCKPKDGLGTGSGPQRKRTGSEPPKEEKQTPRERTGTATLMKPAAVVCHICGREFGTKSIDIHIPQCAKKWEAVEANKPKHERRPVPTAPTTQKGLSRDEYNQAAQEKFNNEGLVPCPNCGRTFLSDRLPIHLRSCKEPVATKKESCPNCSREFLPGKLAVHLRTCNLKPRQKGRSRNSSMQDAAEGSDEDWNAEPENLRSRASLSAPSKSFGRVCTLERLREILDPDNLGYITSDVFMDTVFELSDNVDESEIVDMWDDLLARRLAKEDALPWEVFVDLLNNPEELSVSDNALFFVLANLESGAQRAESKPQTLSPSGAVFHGGDPPQEGALLSCRHCGRSFNEASLARHENICQKMTAKPRKVFNATSKRMPEGAVVVAKKAPNRRKTTTKTDWRAKSEAFREAMKQARVVDKYLKEGRPLSELPPPPPTAPELDDRIPCPHCGRRFGQTQAERHIASCANTVNKPRGPPKAKAGTRSRR